jgi:single-strand DNA-binding protein
VNETLVTLQGNVGGPVKLRRAGDSMVASFRLGCTPRHYQRATDTWVDEETQWFTVNAWRGLADNVEASLRRGDAVVVHGRLRLRTWINADNVEQHTFEVTATAVGHDLSRGTSRFSRPARPGAEAPAETSAETSAEAPSAGEAQREGVAA